MPTISASTPNFWLRKISGGLIAGAVAVVYAASYAALLFPGALEHLLPYGMGLCLISAMLGAFWPMAGRVQQANATIAALQRGA